MTAPLTPQMGYPNPVPSSTVGPDYATDIQTALDVIDGHTHSGEPGDGKQLGTSSLNINADLSYNALYNITNLRSVRFANQSSTLAGVGDVGCAYEKGGDLWYNNAAGTAVQVTLGSGINVTTANTVYALLEVATNKTIVNTDNYVFLDVDTTSARIITLPTAASVTPGRYYIVADKSGNAGTNNITVQKSGTDTIDGQASQLVKTNYGGLIIVSNGVNGWKTFHSWNGRAGITLDGSLAFSGFGSVQANIGANMIQMDASFNLKIGDAGDTNTLLLASSTTIAHQAVTHEFQDLNALACLDFVGNATGNSVMTVAKSTAFFLTQHAQTGDVATFDLILNPQASFASATGTNRTGGNLVVSLPAPTNSGTTPSAVKVKQSSSTYIQLGPYSVGSAYGAYWAGTATPTLTNFAFLGDGATFSYLNAATGGTISLSFGGAGLTGLDLTSTTLSSAIPTWQFYSTVTAPAINQADVTTAAAHGQSLTTHAQNSTGSGATVGGNLILGSGSGATKGSLVQQLGGQTVLTTSVNGGGISILLDATQTFSIFQGGSSQSWYFISGTINFEATTITWYDFGVNKVCDWNLAGTGASNMTLAAGTTFSIAQTLKASGTGNQLTFSAQSVTTGTGASIALTTGTGSVNQGKLKLTCGSQVMGAFETLSAGDTRYTLDPSAAYFVFAANGTSQQVIFQAIGGGGQFTFQTSTVNFQDASLSQTMQWTLAATSICTVNYVSTVSAVNFVIASTAVNSATAASWTLSAQTATGTTSIGGSIFLNAGTGTSQNGAVVIQCGGVNQVTIGNNVMGFDSASSAFINIFKKTGTGASAGQTFFITGQAGQNVASGTNNNGGALQIASGAPGTGGSGGTAGALTLVAGATTRLTANATGLGFYTATAVAQATKIANYTDSTAGTPGTTLAAVTGTTYSTDIPTIRNWIASLNKQVNDLKNQLSAAAGGIGITT